jgi:hypothetical protein
MGKQNTRSAAAAAGLLPAGKRGDDRMPIQTGGRDSIGSRRAGTGSDQRFLRSASNETESLFSNGITGGNSTDPPMRSFPSRR